MRFAALPFVRGRLVISEPVWMKAIDDSFSASRVPMHIEKSDRKLGCLAVSTWLVVDVLPSSLRNYQQAVGPCTSKMRI